MLAFRVSLSSLRLNLDEHGPARAHGPASAVLDLDNIDFEVEHPDQGWFAGLSTTCVLEPASSAWLSKELRNRSTDNPALSYAALSLNAQHLHVRCAIEPHTYEILWRLLERHLGNASVGVEVCFGLTGFYDETDPRTKTMRALLSQGDVYVGPVSIDVVTSGWHE